MRDLMGIIYSGDNDNSLKELTMLRTVAAVPFAGRYRIIDFILSNMVNSGIRNIGIIAQNNYHALFEHLDSGKEWDLDRKQDGLFIFPPYVGLDNADSYLGELDTLHNIMNYIRKSTQEYVLITGSYMICNINFEDVLKFHKEKNADITLLYKEDKKAVTEELQRHTLIRTDENHRIYDMEFVPSRPKTNKISMEMYLIEKNLLEYLVEESISRKKHDSLKDLIMRNIDTLKICGYPYTGYLARVDGIRAYFKHSMELLDPDNRRELFFRNGPIYTKTRDEAPTKYGYHSKTGNSLVADGCVIEGRIENSILFPGVKVAEGTVVKNSIIMQNSEVQEKAIIENVILDKEVIVRRGKRLIGQENYPVLIRKKAII